MYLSSMENLGGWGSSVGFLQFVHSSRSVYILQKLHFLNRCLVTFPHLRFFLESSRTKLNSPTFFPTKFEIFSMALFNVFSAIL